MSDQKEPGSKTDRFEIHGHAVAILRRKDREELWIDGIRRRYIKTDEGYNLYDDAYEPPQKSLIDAVELYLHKYPGSGSEPQQRGG